MNQHQSSGSTDDAKDVAQQPAAKPSGQAGGQPKGPAGDKDSRLRRAYGKVKEALKNSRHT